MSLIKYSTSNLLTGFMPDRFILFLLFLLFFISGQSISHATELSSDNYQLAYDRNQISISATKADLKDILIDLAERADISIRYPASLDDKITLKISNLSLKKALKRLLKDFNYSIVYSGSKKQSVISDVFIYKKTNRTPQVNSSEARTASRIKSYERRIESLKTRLSQAGENSARGKRYLNQIKSYEKTIERLKNQIK